MASHTPITNSVKKHSLKRKVFTGTFIQSKNLTELEIWRDTCVCVDEHGVIVKIAEVRGEQDVLECVGELDWDREEVVFEGSNEGVGERFFFPGFIGMVFIFLPLFLYVGLIFGGDFVHIYIIYMCM